MKSLVFLIPSDWIYRPRSEFIFPKSRKPDGFLLHWKPIPPPNLFLLMNPFRQKWMRLPRLGKKPARPREAFHLETNPQTRVWPQHQCGGLGRHCTHRPSLTCDSNFRQRLARRNPTHQSLWHIRDRPQAGDISSGCGGSGFVSFVLPRQKRRGRPKRQHGQPFISLRFGKAPLAP